MLHTHNIIPFNPMELNDVIKEAAKYDVRVVIFLDRRYPEIIKLIAKARKVAQVGIVSENPICGIRANVIFYDMNIRRKWVRAVIPPMLNVRRITKKRSGV